MCEVFGVEMGTFGTTDPFENSPQILVVSPLFKAQRFPIVLPQVTVFRHHQLTLGSEQIMQRASLDSPAEVQLQDNQTIPYAQRALDFRLLSP
jgi:hypothetical protein